MWDTNRNEWNTDGPIIFRISNKNYEFVSYKLDEFSITINTIDLSIKLDWYGMGDELPLVWKKNALTEINQHLGKRIKEVYILTYNFISTTIEDKAHPENAKRIYQTGNMLHGIEFVLPKSGLLDRKNYLSIFNGLDQIGVTTEYVEQGNQIKRIKITGANKSFVK